MQAQDEPFNYNNSELKSLINTGPDLTHGQISKYNIDNIFWGIKSTFQLTVSIRLNIYI